MLVHKITKQTFPTRKDAKLIMGHAKYNQAVKNGEFEFKISTHKASDVIL